MTRNTFGLKPDPAASEQLNHHFSHAKFGDAGWSAVRWGATGLDIALVLCARHSCRCDDAKTRRSPIFEGVGRSNGRRPARYGPSGPAHHNLQGAVVASVPQL